MSDTFYLKYRPQKVSQLDLKDIREELAKVLSSAKIPHAFLFSGPKGLGKTSAARIVAKVVNCETRKQAKKARKSLEPCNKCESCKSITAGTAIDLIEIDAASNRGIDDIRNLKEKIKLVPTEMKKKVYVIDEVHMLTTEAFNALLKTLEEPPKHVLFILCTTEIHKLPETIKSRCLLFNFKKATSKELMRSLKRVIKGEGLRVKEEVLKKIASAADGSFRDATKILEQLSFKSKVIKEEDFDSLFKETNFWGPEFFWLLKKRKIRKLLISIDNLIKSGGDLKSFTHWILDVLRAMLLLKFGVEVDDIDGLKINSKTLLEYDFSPDDIKRLIAIFDRASRELRMATVAQLPLEIAIIEWCEDKTKNQNRLCQDFGRQAKVKSDNEKSVKKTEKPAPISNAKNIDVKIEDIKEKWQNFLKEVRSKNHSIEALLKASVPVKINDDSLTIEVFYEFHKGKLENESCLQLVEQTFQEVFIYPLKVKYILGKKRNFQSYKKENNDIDLTKDEQLIKTAEEIFINKKNS